MEDTQTELIIFDISKPTLAGGVELSDLQVKWGGEDGYVRVQTFDSSYFEFYTNCCASWMLRIDGERKRQGGLKNRSGRQLWRMRKGLPLNT